jgi:hypothetical protein
MWRPDVDEIAKTGIRPTSPDDRQQFHGAMDFAGIEPSMKWVSRSVTMKRKRAL